MDSGEDTEKVGVMDVHMKSFMKRGKNRFSWEAEMLFVYTKKELGNTEIAKKIRVMRSNFPKN